MKTLLWLDDVRDPFEYLDAEDGPIGWLVFSPLSHPFKTIWVKSYDEFTQWIEANGLPDGICFDHDISSEEKTGYDAAKWLCNYCDDKNLSLPLWNIQSANPVGKENIKSYLTNYAKHRDITT
jgi:hypothetical protein